MGAPFRLAARKRVMLRRIGMRQVIDISGDGANNQGRIVTAAALLLAVTFLAFAGGVLAGVGTALILHITGAHGARLAGDEFVIVLEGLNVRDEASLVAGKIIASMRAQ